MGTSAISKKLFIATVTVRNRPDILLARRPHQGAAVVLAFRHGLSRTSRRGRRGLADPAARPVGFGKLPMRRCRRCSIRRSRSAPAFRRRTRPPPRSLPGVRGDRGSLFSSSRAAWAPDDPVEALPELCRSTG
jgi:hypothetical protein